ncbi:MAG TPA: peptidase [Bacteroidia bacterium]|jgi:hypothetical protein|nr:peptidase [Bacteroidia bacterium]
MKTIGTIRTTVLLMIASMAMLLTECRKDFINQGPLAVKAKDFLSSKDYNALEVEIAYVDGHRPTDAAVNHLLDMMKARLNKPDGINVTYKTIGSPRMSSFTIGDLDKVERDQRDIFTKHDHLTAFVLFLDAPYAANSSALGVAYGTTSIAVFESEIERYSGGISQPSRDILEATVIEHEFGHLFGLVDNGTPMTTPHMDPSNNNHCNNSKCLMYYAVETSDVVANLIGSDVPQFDANCIADLRANGGK